MIRVLVMDRDRSTAEAVAGALSVTGEVRAEETAVSAAGVLEALGKPGTRVDAVVTSVHAGQDEVLGLARTLRDMDDGPALVVTGLPRSSAVILRYLEAGVDAYMTEELAVSGLVLVLRMLERGDALVSPGLARTLIERLHALSSLLDRSGVDVSGMDALTPREREVLGLLGDGLTNRQIGKRLFIEVGTVKSHVHQVLKKLGVPTREEARRVLILARTGASAGGRNGAGAA